MPSKSKPKNVAGKPLNNAIQTKDTPHTEDFQNLLDKILKPVLGEDLTEEKIKYLKDNGYDYDSFIAMYKTNRSGIVQELEKMNCFLKGQVPKIVNKISSELNDARVSLKELCLTAIPDLQYSDSLKPLSFRDILSNRMSPSPTPNSPSTVVSEKQKHNRYCRSVTPFDFDLDKYFATLIERYDLNPNIEPLLIEKKHRQVIKVENDMNSYIGVALLYPFLSRVSENISSKPHEMKHKFTFDYLNLGKPDFVVKCEDHDFWFIVEMKLDRKFYAGTGNKSIIEFYNGCQQDQEENNRGHGKCKHYVCNAIFQIYCYLANANSQFGMLSTFERTWICKIEKDMDGKVQDKMHIAGPYATSKAAANKFKDIEEQPYLKVAFVLFFLMHESGEAFKASMKIDTSAPLAGDSDDDQNRDQDKNNDKDPDYRSPKPPKSKKPRRSSSDSDLSRVHFTRSSSTGTSSTEQDTCSIVTTTPPHSKSPFSKQKTSLHLPNFENVKSLDVWSGKYAFLGDGRCGKVFMGAVNGKRVAVKVADVSQMDKITRKEIIEEMRNEAKILKYLKDHGYKYAPKLFYCGYWCGSLFFTIATQLIPGHYRTSRAELSETQAKNLDTAIKCLHELNVTHNDLKWNNVLFCDNDQVFIIDYGFAKLFKNGPISINDEHGYDLE